MKLAVLLVLSLLSSASYQIRVLVPEIGSKLPARVIPKKNRNVYMTHSAQFRPYIEREFENVTYIIAYDDKTRVVKYLSTTDKDFWNSRGLRVGDFIEVERDKVQVFPGWEVRAPADEDGWQPMIGFDTDSPVNCDPNVVNPYGCPYRLPAEPVFKTRIIAFVKGGN